MAYCPMCNGQMGQMDLACARCGYTFPPSTPAHATASTRARFGIRFLFFLMVLTATTFSICSCLADHRWVLAPAILVTGILIWHARKVAYAVLPGLVLGFAIGIVLSGAANPIDKLGTGLWAATLGCPINAICKGFVRSGLVALIASIVSTLVMANVGH